MMRQYQGIKAQNPDSILFFRMGDFYEMFFEDAVTAARILNLTLTTRDRNSPSPVPMAGVPWHAADRYISRLIKAGHRVAVCDQIEDPATAKGIVDRAVTEVVTPGTVLSEGLLAEKENNFLAAVVFGRERTGLALADVSTGEFYLDDPEPEALREALERWAPREVLVAEESTGRIPDGYVVTRRPGWQFTPLEGEETLTKHFRMGALEGLGIDFTPATLGASGALLRYLKEVRNGDLRHITGIGRLESAATMVLDDTTRRNLEIFKPAFPDGPDTSLIGVLDRTVTAAGGRRLRAWLERPLLDARAIEARLAAVADLIERNEEREELVEAFREAHDLERLLGRAACGKATPRDIKALGDTAVLIPGIRKIVEGFQAVNLLALAEGLRDLAPLGQRILGALVDEPPAQSGDGGIFRTGYNAELDEVRAGSLTGKEWIATLQKKERERTGINSLKVGFNKVFGYYLEVTKANLAQVPEDYIRKQTLVNAERFVTPRLKEEEAKVLGAEERIRKIEAELFRELRDAVVDEAEAIRETAASLAEIDAGLSLARASRERGFTRPVLAEDTTLLFREARHPVVEKLLPAGQFVPNDLDMDAADRQILVITGPNMAGKSTYLRQTALVVLMAQVGCFVPAAEARVGIVDRIFTRIGAADSIARGRSTFMVEMQETAAILRNATDRSLVILDEVGRGTSTFDGLSIAWAVTEYLHEGGSGRPRTLFATHYHELTHLSAELPRVVNLNVLVKEWNDEVRFLHKIVPGAADRSYGIHVARLAGLPEPVLVRARMVLSLLEAGRFDKVEKTPPRPDAAQMDLFSAESAAFREDLAGLDPENMTPIEALVALQKLISKYGE